MTPTADESAIILTNSLIRCEPFFFIRYGDGALECIYEPDRGHTCDQERYTNALANGLMLSWMELAQGSSTVFAGDWLAASFDGNSDTRYEQWWTSLKLSAPFFEWLHPEALLLMRESAALVDFYRTVRADTRRKLYMGPQGNWPAARFLGACHLVTPMDSDLHQRVPYLSRVLKSTDFDVLLYGAGMAGNIAAVNCWREHPERTYISLGSALDPLFRGKSRSQQLPPAKLREMFKEML